MYFSRYINTTQILTAFYTNTLLKALVKKRKSVKCLDLCTWMKVLKIHIQKMCMCKIYLFCYIHGTVKKKKKKSIIPVSYTHLLVIPIKVCPTPLITAVAVSYTHLDVYKRQQQHRMHIETSGRRGCNLVAVSQR